MEIKFKKLTSTAKIPTYGSLGAAACDLYADLESSIILHPGERRVIHSNISIEIPMGFEGQIRPRSGLALKNGITVLNSPGTIDSDYRGSIGATLINLSKDEFIIYPGDRIAQLIISPVIQVTFKEVFELSETKRGEGGFGSTGIK